MEASRRLDPEAMLGGLGGWILGYVNAGLTEVKLKVC